MRSIDTGNRGDATWGGVAIVSEFGSECDDVGGGGGGGGVTMREFGLTHVDGVVDAHKEAVAVDKVGEVGAFEHVHHGLVGVHNRELDSERLGEGGEGGTGVNV